MKLNKKFLLICFIIIFSILLNNIHYENAYSLIKILLACVAISLISSIIVNVIVNLFKKLINYKLLKDTKLTYNIISI